MKTFIPIEIFKPGKHIAMSGAVLEFTESDVAATAAAYDAAVHEAPLVVGHPATDDPAYGSVSALSYADGVLQAIPQNVDQNFADLVNAGRFYKVSASFYSPQSPVNPVPGVWYLKHVGFLGAQPPAVKGLKSPSFADAEGVMTFEFGEELDLENTNGIKEDVTPHLPTGESLMTPEEIAAKKAELDAKEAQLKADNDALAQDKAQFTEREQALKTKESASKISELTNFTEGLVKEGRLLPKDQAGLVAFMCATSAADAIEFAEGGEVVKKPGHEWLKGFLKALPVQVSFKEHDKPGSAAAGLTDTQIARKAQEYKASQDKAGNNISFVEAVDYVNAELVGGK